MFNILSVRTIIVATHIVQICPDELNLRFKGSSIEVHQFMRVFF